MKRTLIGSELIGAAVAGLMYLILHKCLWNDCGRWFRTLAAAYFASV
jgi:hypothetical protein